MALQQNNLMLLDSTGLPRTIDQANDSIGIGVDLTVGGDLTVNGDIVSGGTMDIVVTDNFIDLSNGNITGAKAGGLTINVEANANHNMAAGAVGATFQSIADAAGAFATLSIDSFDPNANGIAAGDIIEISGLSDLGENNGLFVVQSAAAGVGGVMEIKNTNGASVPFCQTNFESGTEDAGIFAYQLDLGIITISDGNLPDGGGGTIAKGSFATAYAADATDAAAGNPGALTYGDAAAVSLQEAYDEGQTIDLLNATGDMVITTDESPGNEADFQVIKGGGAFSYLRTDAPNDTLVLGAMNGVTPETKIAVDGQIVTDVGFDGTQAYQFGNMTPAGLIDDLTIGAQSLNLYASAMGAAAGAQASLASGGLNGAAEMVATNAYVAAASVAGDISGEIVDVNGAGVPLTITFGAAAADLAALIAGATVAPVGAVVLSDDGSGKLKMTSAALGQRVRFSFDAESVGGVAASVGIPALPTYSINGKAAARLSADDNTGDTKIRAGRHLDMISYNGSMEIKTQTAGQQIEVNAQSGSLALLGTSNVELRADGGGVQVATNSAGHAVEIGVGSAVGSATTVQSNSAVAKLSATGAVAGARVVLESAGTGTKTGTGSAVFIEAAAGDARLRCSGANEKLWLEALNDGELSVGNDLTIYADNDMAIDANNQLDIGQNTPVATKVGTSSLVMTSTDNSSWTQSTAGKSLSIAVAGGLSQKLSLASAGTGVDAMDISSSAGGVKINAATGMELGAGGALNAITAKGWLAQDTGTSAGWGATFKSDAAGAVTVPGDMFAMYNNAGTAEGKTVGASDAEAVGICGVWLEATLAAGDDAKAHTIHGAQVTLSFDGSGLPGAGEVGTPVYLSATSGKAAKTAPTASGQHVVRLGFAMQAGTGKVLWAPQYIAKRP